MAGKKTNAKAKKKLDATVDTSKDTTTVSISGPIDRAAAAFDAEISKAANNVSSLKAMLGPGLAAALRELR